MIRTSPRPLARRASLVAGALVAGTIAATAAPATAAPLPLPTCTINLTGLPSDGIPVPGTNLTSTVVLNGPGGLLSVNLPILQAVVTIPDGSALPTLPAGVPSPSSISYLVTNNDIGKQIVALGQINSVDTSTPAGTLLSTLLTTLGIGTPTSPIACTPVVSPPVVSPPAGGGSTTTLGATPVSSTPRVAGKVKVKKTVRADLGTVQPGVVASYQWYKKRKHHAARGIAGATGATLKIKKGLRSKKIWVVVTYSKAGYTPTVLASPTRRVR